MAAPKKGAEKAIVIAAPNPIEIIKGIDAKLAEIGNVSGDGFRTGNNQIAGICIKECKELAGLVKLAGLVTKEKENYVLGQQILGLETVPEFKINGCTGDEIIHDIQKQVSILTYGEQVKKLNELKKQWQEFITKEDKKQALIEEMSRLGFEV